MNQGVHPHELGQLEAGGHVAAVGPDRKKGEKTVIKEGREADRAQLGVAEDHEGQIHDPSGHHVHADRIIPQMTEGVFDLASDQVQLVEVQVVGEGVLHSPGPVPLRPGPDLPRQAVVRKQPPNGVPKGPGGLRPSSNGRQGADDGDHVHHDHEPGDEEG